MPSFNPGLVLRYLLSAVSYYPRTTVALFTGGTADKIDKAIGSHFKNSFSSLEKADISAIESIRKTLLRSPEVISVTEFGRGSNILPKTASTEKISDICSIMSKTESECHFLYSLIKTIKPTHCMELGTCLGISTAYIGMALRHNGHGTLTSFEGSPERAKIATQNIKELGLENNVSLVQGKFQDVLPEYLQKTTGLDFAFIDGHHQEEATLHYFKMILPKFVKGGIIIFDDIFWSTGMNRAWKTIKTHPNVTDSFVFKGMGIIQLEGVRD